MSWELRRRIDADSNVYDRYAHEPEGAAVVYKKGRTLFGSVNGVPFSVQAPPEGNVQAARIRYEGGDWNLFVYTDPADGVRAEWKVKVA